ncbi:MAG: SDR family oxidoreductase [Acidobacteria bacterium]|nr:SDR family oxidoreductase [Acidobacteriota bacterium]
MILVTGAGGTVGREVVQALQREGLRFRAAYHTEEKAAKARGSGLDAVTVDFAKPDSLRPALRGVSKLFLLSAATPDLAEQEMGVVEQAKQAGVGHLVKISVWRASEEEFTFARWHRSSEKAIQASGVPFTFLRPNSFMQNLSTYYAQSIRATRTIALPAGHAKESCIDVRDIASVAARVFSETTHFGHAYDLSGPESLSYHQVANTLSVALGRKITYVDVSDEEFSRGMRGSGAPPWLTDAILEMQHYAKRGQAADVLGSVQQILGRRPLSLDRFARDYSNAFL